MLSDTKIVSALQFFADFTAAKAIILLDTSSNVVDPSLLINNAKNALLDMENNSPWISAFCTFTDACAKLESKNPISLKQNLDLINTAIQATSTIPSPHLSDIQDGFIETRILNHLQVLEQVQGQASKDNTVFQLVDTTLQQLLLLANQIKDATRKDEYKKIIEFFK